ncbi:ribonuclease HII [Candidatus Saccharibacteria bacterium]|nr:ribonuclease HII [Candidatus Saccharibacteria bacterium]
MLIGVDEVGRGPLAGPLLVGAVSLAEPVAGLADSKKLSPKSRAELDLKIRATDARIGLGWVYIDELNKIGLSEGLRVATFRAVSAVLSVSDITSDLNITIDGTVNFLKDTPYGPFVTTLKKADQLVAEVSAASIVAKQARDAYMIELAAKYPDYGFDRHMGYGTAVHLAALDACGPCPEHRTFYRPVREVMGRGRGKGADFEAVPSAAAAAVVVAAAAATTVSVGRQAEQVVRDYLIRHGHEILVQNYRNKYVELDIVSEREGEIFVTEVKYRRNDVAGGGLAAITQDKIQRLRRGALMFLQDSGRGGQNVRLLAACVAADLRIQSVVEI